MNRRNRTQLGLGLLLILAAAWLIATKINPELTDILHLNFEWPMWIVISGGIILLIGLLVGAPGMAVPACIVAGIGGILYYFNATGNWVEWYFWLLVPGLAGIGELFSGLLGGTFRQSARSALNTIFVSIVLFAIFASLFGGTELFGPYSEYLPIALLFLLGLWLILRGIFRRNKPTE